MTHADPSFARSRSLPRAWQRPLQAVFLAACTFVGAADAQDGGGQPSFDVDHSVVAGGGGVSSGGSFTLTGTIGQVAASPMGAGSFDISVGFWPAQRHYCERADANCDGGVDGVDLGLLISNWGQCSGCPSDINNDGEVDGVDLGLLLSLWG